MKKMLIIFLVLLTLTGCNTKEKQNKEDNIKTLTKELSSFFGYECKDNICINSYNGGDSETDESHIKIDFNEKKIYKREILDSGEFNYDITFDYKNNIVTMDYKNIEYDETLEIKTKLDSSDEFDCTSTKAGWHKDNNYNICNPLKVYSEDFKDFFITLLESLDLTIEDIK